MLRSTFIGGSQIDLIMWHIETHQVTATDRATQVSAASFDAQQFTSRVLDDWAYKFLSIEHARSKIEAWRVDYNRVVSPLFVDTA